MVLLFFQDCLVVSRLSACTWVTFVLLALVFLIYLILFSSGCPPVPWLPWQPGGESARTGRLLASHHPLAAAHAGVYQLQVQQRQNQHQLHLQMPQLMSILLLDLQSTDTIPTHTKIVFFYDSDNLHSSFPESPSFLLFPKNNFTMLT